MLEQCHAYVVGKDEEHDYELMKAAASLGFTTSSKLFRKGLPQVSRSRTRLSFFLVHHHLEDASVRSLVARIRRDPSDQIRFAPLILFTHDGPFEVVLRYIRFGFDDVIALPERRDLVAGRLASQLEQEFTYFETADYFGPDRRRMERPGAEPDERRSGGHPHTRHTIIRSVDRGVRVLRVETLNDNREALQRDTRRPRPPSPTRRVSPATG
jgi:CheY-like chemotaxis protein